MTPAFAKAALALAAATAPAAATPGRAQSLLPKDYVSPLTVTWQLDSTTAQHTFLLSAYRPVYVLPARWSGAPNDAPSSANPRYTTDAPVDYTSLETKIQLSLKTKVLHGVLGGRGDVWVAYSQQSHWQVYNPALSRPFRETNYEPELIFNYPLYARVGRVRLRMAGVALVHQSNGRSLPLSRSWNRVVAHLGLESGHWNLVVRPWLRIPESDDENPDILEYLGRGDATVSYNSGRHTIVAVQLRRAGRRELARAAAGEHGVRRDAGGLQPRPDDGGPGARVRRLVIPGASRAQQEPYGIVRCGNILARTRRKGAPDPGVERVWNRLRLRRRYFQS